MEFPKRVYREYTRTFYILLFTKLLNSEKWSNMVNLVKSGHSCDTRSKLKTCFVGDKLKNLSSSPWCRWPGLPMWAPPRSRLWVQPRCCRPGLLLPTWWEVAIRMRGWKKRMMRMKMRKRMMMFAGVSPLVDASSAQNLQTPAWDKAEMTRLQ